MSVTLNTQAMKYRETTADEWVPVTIQTEAEVNAVVQDTEPAGNENVWFDTSDESEVVVPTMDDLNDKLVWTSVTVTFDSSGVGTFTKTGYTLISGFYDDNWAVETYGTNRIRCHYKNNWTQLITSTTGTLWGAFLKTS